MKTKLITGIVVIAALGFGLMAINDAMALPDVHFSYATQQCVEVINYADTNFSCENMPEKFYHVWVQ